MKPTDRLDRLYAKLPKLECKGLCHGSCGPVLMSRREWSRIIEQNGAVAPVGEDLNCPLLDKETKRCTVYAIRPLICRIWGMVKQMQCPHGCVPERWLTDADAKVLLDEAKRIGGRPDGPNMDVLQKLLAKAQRERQALPNKT